MKTYVLPVSLNFPKTHFRSGQSTGFVEAIKNLFDVSRQTKIHTIRANYNLWKHRIDKINKGEAVLSIRYWSGKPYRSKQVEILVLEKVGIEKLENPNNFVCGTIEGRLVNWDEIAKNDGLSLYDFSEWFKKASQEPMAIIHFTNFRYKKS